LERGVYFDGWFKHNHCYHPSLPLRSLQMLEDLEKFHGTMLIWAGMGGGSISLPYLEHEAFGPVDPRMRFYGYMNDSEFVAECEKRGIKLFGIVFEVQGWEFPAVFDKDGKIVRLNLHAEQGEHDWYGLREFSQDKYPNAFPTSLKDYYPDGIYNSLGEKVTDLWEECCTRDMHGVPIHAAWVEVKNHEQIGYQMCRNNPVWRDYLKKIIKIQIDAGVQGVQLDECELPMTSMGAGGCFCKDCMREFTEYLVEQKAKGKLSSEWDDIDVANFNYKEYLLERNSTYPEGAPFYKEYWEFQVREVEKYFSELADFARDYAMETYNRKVLVSGNFYNLQPAYYPIQPKVDVMITEMEHSLFRQPYFYRYSAGFADGKPMIIAENPYGGIVPELVQLLDKGKGYDLYRIFMLEASVYGCNMSVPYGGWMGNTIKDAFWPPRALTCEIQDFLYEHENFYPKTPVKGVAVLYSFGSNYWRDAHRAGNANADSERSNMEHLEATTTDWGNTNKPMPFWDTIRELSSQNAMYDVRMMADDEFRKDDLGAETLALYPMIVLPDCYVITQNQAQLIEDYAKNGGKVLVYGRLAENTDLVSRLQGMDNVKFVATSEDMKASMEVFRKEFADMYATVSAVSCSDTRLGMQRFDADGKTYVHLLNYCYDNDKDQIEPIDEVEITLKEVSDGTIHVYHLDGETTNFEVKKDDETVKVILKDVPVYTVVTVE